MASTGAGPATRSASASLRSWLGSTRADIVGRHPSSLPRRWLDALSAGVTNSAQLAKWAVLGLPARGRLFTADRFELLDRALGEVRLDGLWLEFGVYRGASINHIAERARRPIVGFDSFEGLPQAWTPRIPAGTFTTGRQLPEVRPEVTLVPGWFSETLPGFLASQGPRPVAFLHVDCDLYSSTRTILSALGDRVRTGTVVVFDEFCGLFPEDEERAWREFRRRHRLRYRWIGCALNGAVALVVTRNAASEAAPASPQRSEAERP